jgi:hypothetical protein
MHRHIIVMFLQTLKKAKDFRREARCELPLKAIMQNYI